MGAGLSIAHSGFSIRQRRAYEGCMGRVFVTEVDQASTSSRSSGKRDL